MAAITIDRAFPFGPGIDDVDSQVASDDDWREISFYFGCTDGVGDRGRNTGNGFETFGDSTSMAVKVKSGECWIRGTYGRNADQETLTLAGSAPPGGQSRIAIVVLRLDITNKLIAITEVQGSNGATPTAPSLTQTSTVWDIPLAQVTIPSTGVIAAGAVIDARLFARSFSGPRPGALQPWPTANNFPPGWILADGATVNRATYPELGAVISPGSSATFVLPDMRGEVFAGLDDMGSGAAGVLTGMASVTTRYGEQTHVLTEGELATHAHAIDHDHPSFTTVGASGKVLVLSGGATAVTTYGTGSTPFGTQDLTIDVPAFTGTSGNDGSSTAHNNVQPTHVGYWLIAARPT